MSSNSKDAQLKMKRVIEKTRKEKGKNRISYSKTGDPNTYTVCVIKSEEDNIVKFLPNCSPTDLIGAVIVSCQEFGIEATFRSSKEKGPVIDGTKEMHKSIIFNLANSRGFRHKVEKGIDLVYKASESIQDFCERIISRRDAVRKIHNTNAVSLFDIPFSNPGWISEIVPTKHALRMSAERNIPWGIVEDTIRRSTQVAASSDGSFTYRKDKVQVIAILRPGMSRSTLVVITLYQLSDNEPELQTYQPSSKSSTAPPEQPSVISCVAGLIDKITDSNLSTIVELVLAKNNLKKLEQIYVETVNAETLDLNAAKEINTKIISMLTFIVSDANHPLFATGNAIYNSLQSDFEESYRACLQAPESYNLKKITTSPTEVDVELLQSFKDNFLKLLTLGFHMFETYHADLTVMVRLLRGISGANCPAAKRLQVNGIYNCAHSELKSIVKP